ncbi:MAG: hypothetical protein AB7E12_10520 [Burkholderiaceae bacterium]
MTKKNTVYKASPIKRPRATKAEMIERFDRLEAIVNDIKPCTVRQVFYQATVRGVVEKTEAGYAKVQIALVELRRSGRIGYGAIADNTRWQRKPNTYGSLQEALDEAAQYYRRDLWRSAAVYCEVWLEKDALSGVIWPITSKYDVPLMVARGYSSLTFLAAAAEAIREQGRPCFIYHLGDLDPSGVNAAEKIEETLRELAPDAEIHFQRLAVTEEQAISLRLPSRPTKKTDSRAKKFGRSESVELDSIEPSLLRDIVEQAILSHVNHHELEVIKVAEESERAFMRSIATAYG